MDHASRIAFINAQVVCALAEIEGMKAENKERERNGLALAYGEKDFQDVQLRFMISHNAVIDYLRK